MAKTSRSDPRPHMRRQAQTQGYSLIELLVALAILALAAAVVPANVVKTGDGQKLRRTVHDVETALKSARLSAIKTRDSQIVLIDVAHRQVLSTASSKVILLPDAVEISLVAASNEQATASQAGSRFFPDGSSTGGRLTLVSASSTIDLSVDWLTGKVSQRTVQERRPNESSVQ